MWNVILAIVAIPRGPINIAAELRGRHWFTADKLGRKAMISSFETLAKLPRADLRNAIVVYLKRVRKPTLLGDQADIFVLNHLRFFRLDVRNLAPDLLKIEPWQIHGREMLLKGPVRMSGSLQWMDAHGLPY